MNHQEEFLLKRIDKFSMLLILLFAILAIFGVINWFSLDLKPEYSINKNESALRAAYGALGDYLGGILNPIFGFLGLFVLLWTLRVTRAEMQETKKALYNQETELLLARLSDVFIKQCERINLCIDSFSASYRKDSKIIPEKQSRGAEVLYDLSIVLYDIQTSPDSHKSKISIRGEILLPNSRKILNYVNTLSSSFEMFLNTITLYQKNLEEKEKRQLFILIESITSYEFTYFNLHLLEIANELSADTGMRFPFGEKIQKIRNLMNELNKLCQPEKIIETKIMIKPPFEVQEYGKKTFS